MCSDIYNWIKHTKTISKKFYNTSSLKFHLSWLNPVNTRLHKFIYYTMEILEQSLLQWVHNSNRIKGTELGTLEWWISGLMINPFFLPISRLT